MHFTDKTFLNLQKTLFYGEKKLCGKYEWGKSFELFQNANFCFEIHEIAWNLLPLLSNIVFSL